MNNSLSVFSQNMSEKPQRTQRLTHGLQDKLVLSDGQWRLDADGQLGRLDNTAGLHLDLHRDGGGGMCGIQINK